MSEKISSRDIFGGSESELSSEEDNFEKPQGNEPDFGDSDAGSEDEYVHERQQPAKLRKKRLSRKGDADGGERPSRKRKRKVVEPQPEINLDDLPPEQAAKIRLDRKLDAILKPKKAYRPRKRKNNDEVLDSFADDEVARLRENMNAAAEEDIRANSEKLPGTAKLRILPTAMETLRKASLAQSMIDNNLLEAVKRWLEPLPDRSLPSLTIQRPLFDVLKRMEFIDSSVLKESGLGKVVLFYTKCRRVTPDVKRIADDLVATWSRPIIKRSASYKDRIIPLAEEAPDIRVERLNSIIAKAKEAEKDKVRKNAVSIPQPQYKHYDVAPRPNAGVMRTNVSVDMDIERRKKNAERLRSLTRKIQQK